MLRYTWKRILTGVFSCGAGGSGDLLSGSCHAGVRYHSEGMADHCIDRDHGACSVGNPGNRAGDPKVRVKTAVD